MNIINKIKEYTIMINEDSYYGWKDCSLTLWDIDKNDISKIIDIKEDIKIKFKILQYCRIGARYKDITIKINKLYAIKKMKNEFILFCDYTVPNNIKNPFEEDQYDINKLYNKYKKYNLYDEILYCIEEWK